VILPVVLLPDTALLVPGAAGRADPLAGLRAAAVEALTEAWGQVSGNALTGARRAPDACSVLVIAPGTRDRDLHGARGSLTAAGVPVALVPEVGPVDGPRADVPASVALHLLHAAGVPLDAVRVVEVARATAGAGIALPDPMRISPERISPVRSDAVPIDAVLPDLLVVVGSLSARDGEDAPLAADPDAPALDEALVTALGTGPAALAAVLEDPADLAALAVSGAGPWRALLRLLAGHDAPVRSVDPAAPARVLARTAGTALGAHVVARWLLDVPDPARAPVPDPARAAHLPVPAAPNAVEPR
jgi:hypothetical protein